MNAIENVWANIVQWGQGSGYPALIDSMGVETIIHADEGDYQGDSFYLLRDGQRYGYLSFGWGSCSGCDALQGCDSASDLSKLRDELAEDIMWFDAVGDALNFMKNHDWEGDYNYSQAFITKAIEYLSGKL